MFRNWSLVVFSRDGVITTTSDDNIQHWAFKNAQGELENCTAPAAAHYDVDGTLVPCKDAAKFVSMRGIRAWRSNLPKPEETVNLPRASKRPLGID